MKDNKAKLAKYYRLIVAMSILLALLIFFWWLSGYDFDERGPEIAFGAAFSYLFWVFGIGALILFICDFG